MSAEPEKEDKAEPLNYDVMKGLRAIGRRPNEGRHGKTFDSADLFL